MSKEEDEKILAELREKWFTIPCKNEKGEITKTPEKPMIPYISVIIPYFNRINYLKEAIQSVHQYADMPFELIVHDDASVDGSTPEVFSLLPKMSTLIINQGHNLGLCNSMNRLVKMATSEYIAYICDDVAFTSPCFKDILSILTKPYVGFLHLTQSSEPSLNLPPNEPKFQLSGIHSGSALAFRKQTFNEVGGWNEQSFTGASDVTFMTSIFKRGYFIATPYGREYAVNLSYQRTQNKDSSVCMSGFDCSYPRIFNIPSEQYDRECKLREAECNRITNTYNDQPGGITNLGYWNDYTNKLLYTKSLSNPSNPIERIDWEVAKIHNHDRWKEEVTKDSNQIK